MYLLDDVPMSSNSGSISDNGAIIGGAVGGVILLLMIIAVLCIMILSMRRSRRTATNHVNDKVSNNIFKLSNPIVSNNIHNVTEANTMDRLYSTVKPEKCSSRETSDQSNYAHPIQFNDQQSELNEAIRVANDPAYAGMMNMEVDLACGASTGDIKTATDPAYAGNTKLDNDLTCEVSAYTGKDKETAFNGTVTISAATKHHDHGYVVLRDDHLSHNAVTTSNGNTQTNGLQIQTTNNQGHARANTNYSNTIAKTTEYGIINQPQRDDPNSDAAKQTEANYGVVNQPQS